MALTVLVSKPITTLKWNLRGFVVGERQVFEERKNIFTVNLTLLQHVINKEDNRC